MMSTQKVDKIAAPFPAKQPTDGPYDFDHGGWGIQTWLESTG